MIRFLIITLLLSNCSSYKINDLNKYKSSLISKSNDKKKYNLKKVIVSETSISDISDIDKRDIDSIGKSFSDFIKNEIYQKVKFVDLIDRDSINFLKKEVALYEYLDPEKTFSNQSSVLKLADFAIVTDIYDIEYYSKFQSKAFLNAMINLSIIVANKDNGYIPPATYAAPIYKHKMNLHGNISIIKLPELKVVLKIPFTDKEFFSEDASLSSNTVIGSFNNSVDRSTNVANFLLKRIIKKQFTKHIKSIKKFFYPIEVYIADIKKNNKGDLIVMIESGLNIGVKQNMNVSNDSIIVDLVRSNLKIEKNFNIGKVSQYVMNNKSWIKIFDNKKNINLKVGDKLYLYE